ncbi:TET7 [Linum grandiflorum]
MIRTSIIVLGTLNIITFIISLAILISTTFIHHNHPSVPPSHCDVSLQTPIVVLSLLLTLVSVAGFVGACCEIRWLFLIYLSALLLIILFTLGFYVFGFVVASIGGGRDVPGRAYKDYYLGDYAIWLRERVSRREEWSGMRSCLAESEACPALNRSYGRDSVNEFYNARFLAIQSGCCKPPSECGFTYINPTNWTKGVVGNDSSATRNQDCAVWNSDPSVLCYDCDSCKAAFLDTIKTLLRKSIIVGFVLIGFLILVYIVGYLAFRDQIWEGLDSDAGSGDDR